MATLTLIDIGGVPDRLAAARRRSGLSVEDVGALLHLDAQEVTDLEAGARAVPAARLLELAALYRVTPSSVLFTPAR